MEREKLKLFARNYYARENGEAEVNLHRYFLSPEKLDTLPRVAYYDESAGDLITEVETLIAELREYRAALAERYAYLSSAPTVPVVKLERERNYYSKKVTYHLRLFRRYVDTGDEVEESHKTYSGTERKQAIAAYRAYVKAHPGIIAEMDIEKRKWEK